MKHRLTLRLCLILLPIIFFNSACAPPPVPTPFRPPTAIPPPQPFGTTTPVPALFVPASAWTALSTPEAGPCTNGLTFVDDVTFADNSTVLPNANIDKQWLVLNSGTCNWDSGYRLKWVGGNALGAGEEQLIYPARAGTRGTLRILFIAPAEPGYYQSEWQAVDANGSFFDELIFIKIFVSP